MLDAHLSHVEVIGYLLTTGKFTDAFAVFRGFDVLVRNKMIHNQGDFVLMKYVLSVQLLHLPDSYRCGDIISQNQIQIGLDELSRFYLGKAGVGRKDLLCHCHSHDFVLLLSVVSAYLWK